MEQQTKISDNKVSPQGSQRRRRPSRRFSRPSRRFSKPWFCHEADHSKKLVSLQVNESHTDPSDEDETSFTPTIGRLCNESVSDRDQRGIVSSQTGNSKTDNVLNLGKSLTEPLRSRLKEVDALCARLIRWDTRLADDDNQAESGIIRDFHELKYLSQLCADINDEENEITNDSQFTAHCSPVPSSTLKSKEVCNSAENVRCIDSFDRAFCHVSREQEAPRLKIDHLATSDRSLPTTHTSW